MNSKKFKIPPTVDIVFYTFILPLISTLFITLFTNYLFGWKVSIPTSTSFMAMIFTWREEMLKGYFGRSKRSGPTPLDIYFPLQFLSVILLLSLIEAPLYIYLSMFFIPTIVSLAMTLSDGDGCSKRVMAICLVGMVGCVVGLWTALILLLSQ